MSKLGLVLASAALGAAALVLVAPDASARPGRGGGSSSSRPRQASSRLSPPEDGPDRNARGRVDAKYAPGFEERAERASLRVHCIRLDRATGYALYLDDPSSADDTTTSEVGRFTTNRGGVGRIGFDSTDEAGMPFGASMADLQGRTLEVRTADGATIVLTGAVPSFRTR